jgi:hypothetical protein
MSFDTIKDVQTRFLYPFFFEGLEDANRAFLSAKYTRRAGEPEHVWQRDEPPSHLYTDEHLKHVVIFLFSHDPDRGAGIPSGLVKGGVEKSYSDQPPGCKHFKMTQAIADKWLKDLTILEKKPAAGLKPLPVSLVNTARAELFLSPHGTGVLSITLTPGAEAWTQDDVKRFNYQIAQFRRREVVKLRKTHRKDDPNWSRTVPAEKQGSIPDGPKDDAPLSDRLGLPGGKVSVHELIEECLRPLQDNHIITQGLQA